MTATRRGAIFLLLLAGLFASAPVCAAPVPLVAGEELPAGFLPGPLRLTVRLADDHDRAQPLLAIGGPEDGSLLFWLWDTGGRARIGVEDAQRGVSFSPPFAAAPDGPHVIDVAWGALAPGAAPAAADLSGTLRSLLRIAVDGRAVLFRRQAFSLRTTRAFFGANLIGSGLCRPFFRGSEAMLDRGDAGPAEREGMLLANLLPRENLLPGGYSGPLRLRVTLPPGIAGQAEPLLVGWKTGAVALLYVRYDDERHLRFGFASVGWGGPVSDPVEFQPGTEHDLRVSLGFLYPPADHPPQAGDPAAALLPAVLWVEWDGRPVLATVAPGPTVPAGQITLGANLAWPGVTTPAFRGLLSDLQPLDRVSAAGSALGAVFPRVAAPGPAWQGYPGPVRIKFSFPTVWRPGAGEPLLVAGPTGAADTVYVTYEENGRVHFGMDHWGWAPLPSGSLAVAPGSEHELTIGLGALLPPADAPIYGQLPGLAAWRDQVRVDFDGHTIISGVRPANLARPDQITYGTNLAGGSTSGPAFNGRILRLDAVPWAAWANSR